MVSIITQTQRIFVKVVRCCSHPPHVAIVLNFSFLTWFLFTSPIYWDRQETFGPCPPIWTREWEEKKSERNLTLADGDGSPSLKPVDCAAAFKGNKETIKYAQHFKWCNRQDPISDQDYIGFTSNCDMFKQRYGYMQYKVTQEEMDFPLAFSIIMHQNAEQTERLLRMIYRPQNIYCIHVDLKADSSVQKAINSIASCFHNVITPTKQVMVHWAEFSLLEAELSCIRDLWYARKTWKYIINLTGRDFPLKTNWELVQILKSYNGANDIDGTPHRRPLHWTKYSWKKEYWITNNLKDPAPHDFLIHKGSTHIAATRDFITYALFNQSALDLLEWMRDIRVPDEHFYNTLNHNSQKKIPGSYKGDPDLKTFYTRLKIWMDDEGQHTCSGRWVRFVCQLGVGDLHQLVNHTEMFVNKFFQELEPLALDCAEQWYLNRTRMTKGTDFNLEFYKGLPFVANHV